MGKLPDGYVSDETNFFANDLPWERARLARGINKWPDIDLAEIIQDFPVRTLIDGHAYLSDETDQFRKCLKICSSNWPNSKLSRYMDEFAVYSGLPMLTQSTQSIAKRISNIENQLVKPIQKAIAFLGSEEFGSEVLAPYGALYPIYPHRYSTILKRIELYSHEHIEILKLASKPGKKPESDLRHGFVLNVMKFCTFFDPNFEPSRSVDQGMEGYSKFQTAVAILSQPLFVDAKFDGAIRKVVDQRNKAKKNKSDHA